MKTWCVAAAAMVAFAIPTMAGASLIQFVTTGGDGDGSFSINTDSLLNIGAGDFNVAIVNGTGAFQHDPGKAFYTLDSGGGFDNFFGPQLFTDNGTTPSFNLGSYALTDGTDGSLESLSIRSAPGAPAPQIGLGWMAGLASFGALALTRMRKPKMPKLRLVPSPSMM